MNLWRHRLRRARFFLGALIAAALIAAAVAIGLLQLAMPLVAHYPTQLAGFLSRRLHRPVHFDSVQSQWQPSGPLLIVHGLTLGPEYKGGESLSLPRAAIKFDLSAWLKPAHRWVTLRLTGLELSMRHDASGWRVLGLGNPDQNQQAPLQSLPVDLDLRSLTVSIDDAEARHTYVLSSPRLRVVSIGDTLRFGGDVARRGSPQPITVIGRFNPSKQDADLYIAGHALDLASMARGVDLRGFDLRSGHGDLELWGSWRGNELRSAAARFDLRNLALNAPAGRHAAAPALSGVAELNRRPDGWELRYRDAGKPGDDIDDVGGLLLRMQGGGGTRKIAFAARDLDLTPLLPFAGLLPRTPAAVGDWIAAAHPHAQVTAAAMRWSANGRYAVVAHLHALGASAQGKLPGADALHGILRGDEEALSFEMPKQAVTFDYPAVFRQPFAFKVFEGTLVAWREDGTWHFATDRLDFDNDRFGGNGRALVILPGAGHKPFLDAYAMVSHAEVPAAKLFLPSSMPASTIQWLDRGLVAGKVDAGSVVMRGSLDDWPFVNHRGRFDALGRVSDAVLDYGDDWPRADHINATAEFLDNQMIIEATHAETLGNTVTHAIATIPDLGNGELNLAAEGRGSGATLLGFVRSSPVGKDAASTLSNLDLSGDGKLAFTLVLPFARPEDFALDGNLRLSNGAVVAKQWNLTLQAINGALHFDQKGFRADDLQAKWHGAPANLSIALGGDTGNPAYQLQAALGGAFSTTSMLQDYPDLAPLAKVAQGTANFRIGFTIAAGGKPEDAAKTLSVQSDLRGVSLVLPAPLDKPASTALPMNLQLGMPIPGAAIELSLGDLLRARGHLPDANTKKPAALGVMFGTGQPQIPASGMVVNGRAPTLDLGGWAELAAGEGASANPQTNTAAAAVNGLPTLTQAQVATDQALAFGTRLGRLSLRFATTADAHVIDFDGASLIGTLTLPTGDLAQRGISANLQKLYWPATPAAGTNQPAAVATVPAAPTAPAAPGTTSSTAASTSTAPAANATTTPSKPAPQSAATADALSGVAPSSLPPLHISVADLRLGEARLGETHFESVPVANGMHIATMETQSKNVRIHATGDWLGTAQASHSQMTIDLRSDNLGRMLEAFGFGGLIGGGENTHVVIDGSWPGAPTAFALANLEGTLKFSIGEGRILEVKPGMGRLFGLFSIADLPRRLTLDFGDVFKSGFGFNSVTGDFVVKNGNAYTDDVEIKGPAADINIRGRTGLRTHDYDQIVDANPHTGGALAVVGAVVGGPIGAAAGLAISRGLNQAAHARYSITGSWDHPVIATISKTVPKAAPAPASSSAAPPASASSAVSPVAGTSGALPVTLKPKPVPASSVPAAASSSAPDAQSVIPAKAGIQ
ncbi:MAG TPA: YhdP family protein [Rhodanobacteraceae bacterium]